MSSLAKNIWKGLKHVEYFHKNTFVNWILFILFSFSLSFAKLSNLRMLFQNLRLRLCLAYASFLGLFMLLKKECIPRFLSRNNVAWNFWTAGLSCDGPFWETRICFSSYKTHVTNYLNIYSQPQFWTWFCLLFMETTIILYFFQDLFAVCNIFLSLNSQVNECLVCFSASTTTLSAIANLNQNRTVS